MKLPPIQRRSIFLLITASFGMLLSCSSEDVAEDATSPVDTIESFANCTGPQGNYSTEVHSTKDGYTYFHQQHDFDGGTFTVVLPDLEKGYLLDSSMQVADTLNFGIQEMIRAHEFHKMTLFPELFFSDRKMVSKTGSKIKYTATDRSGHPVELFFNEDDLLIQLSLRNPLDTAEVIELFNTKWTESPYGQLVKELEIIQAFRDTFRFNFVNVKINREGFEKLKFE